MALKVQMWTPDTCGCSVTELWDDSLPADQVTYSPVGLVHRCTFHQLLNLVTLEGLYAALKEENPRKNRSVDQFIAVAQTTLDKIVWTFDGARTLYVSAPTVTVSAAKKAQIQSWCDTNLGVGLVVIQ